MRSTAIILCVVLAPAGLLLFPLYGDHITAASDRAATYILELLAVLLEKML